MRDEQLPRMADRRDGGALAQEEDEMSDRDVTVVIGREAIEKAVVSAMHEAFNDNRWDSVLRRNLREEANRQVQAIDTRDLLREEIAKQLPGIVQSVVETMLTAEVKRRGKAMLGDLLAQMEPGR